MRALAAVWAVLSFAAVTSIYGEPSNMNFLNKGLSLTELLPGDEEMVELDGGESLTVCGGAEWRVSPHCMHYDYTSTYLLETFVLDKEVYEAISREGGTLDDKEMIRGSQCLAEKCNKKVELNRGAWCLVMTNMDELNRSSNVTFHYEACLSEGDKDTFIILLLALTGSMLFLLSLCTCVCCCICLRQRKQSSSHNSTMTVQYHPEMGWYMPPNPQDVYATDMYMQQQYAHQAPTYQAL